MSKPLRIFCVCKEFFQEFSRVFRFYCSWNSILLRSKSEEDEAKVSLKFGVQVGNQKILFMVISLAGKIYANDEIFRRKAASERLSVLVTLWKACEEMLRGKESEKHFLGPREWQRFNARNNLVERCWGILQNKSQNATGGEARKISFFMWTGEERKMLSEKVFFITLQFIWWKRRKQHTSEYEALIKAAGKKSELRKNR